MKDRQTSPLGIMSVLLLALTACSSVAPENESTPFSIVRVDIKNLDGSAPQPETVTFRIESGGATLWEGVLRPLVGRAMVVVLPSPVTEARVHLSGAAADRWDAGPWRITAPRTLPSSGDSTGRVLVYLRPKNSARLELRPGSAGPAIAAELEPHSGIKLLYSIEGAPSVGSIVGLTPIAPKHSIARQDRSEDGDLVAGWQFSITTPDGAEVKGASALDGLRASFSSTIASYLDGRTLEATIIGPDGSRRPLEVSSTKLAGEVMPRIDFEMDGLSSGGQVRVYAR